MLDLSSAVVFGWPINNGIECVVSTTNINAIEPSSRMLHKRPPLSGRNSLNVDHHADHPLDLNSLIQIIIRVGDEERDEWIDEYDDDSSDTSQVELILPKLMYRNNTRAEDRWHFLFNAYDYVITYEDDQWTAAKRGDLEALKNFAGVDWTKEDEFESTALYYACHSGAARDVKVVQYLIHAWPGSIPSHVVSRCKKNAISDSVVRLLDNPDDDIEPSSKVQDDLYNNALQCLAGWNIFQEELEGDY